MVKVVIDCLNVTIFDTNLAKNGVSADKILEKDGEKMKDWKNFMKDKPSEKRIALELELDFKKSFGFLLAKEVIDE